MANPLILRLSVFSALGAEDQEALERACRHRRTIGARKDLIREGQQPKSVYVLLDGWAARYTTLEDGRRQISAFLLPGDLFDLDLHLLAEMDHSIGAITRLVVAQIDGPEFEALTDHNPKLTKALMRHQLVMMAIEREWVANIGQRNAYERLAHLLCETYLRLQCVGQAENGSCPFPLTQHDLSEATGMSTVHVNRTLQHLRADGMITLERKRLTIPDLDALKRASLFNPVYLHLGRREQCPTEEQERTGRRAAFALRT